MPFGRGIPLAYLVRRPGGRFDIRESVATPSGPRSRTLATFRDTLSPEVLDLAESRASRRFGRGDLVLRAAALGLPVSERREDRAARDLLAALRRGARVDPVLVKLLRDTLARLPATTAPATLTEAAEWLGAGTAERGRALRDLLRLSDRIARWRKPVRSRPRRAFPRFRSVRGRAARA